MKYARRLLMLFSFLGSAVLSAQTLVDKIVAVVDKEIITESELNERVTFYAAQNHLDPGQTELRKQILDGMVSEKLVLAQALIDSVDVTDDEVTRALDQQIANFVRQIGSEQRVEQLYGKSISRIKRDYRNDIKNQLLGQKVRQQHEANVSISHHEVEDFFASFKDSLPQVPEEYQLSHIYMVPRPDTSVEVKTRARFCGFCKTVFDRSGFCSKWGRSGMGKAWRLCPRVRRDGIWIERRRNLPPCKNAVRIPHHSAAGKEG
jgi:peptidyl-prolyl cis-trans isomerase SurA